MLKHAYYAIAPHSDSLLIDAKNKHPKTEFSMILIIHNVVDGSIMEGHMLCEGRWMYIEWCINKYQNLVNKFFYMVNISV